MPKVSVSEVSCLWWLKGENDIKTESGKELDFHTHRYLIDPYEDNSKYLVCLKAGQIGFSTMVILKTIWWASQKKMNIGYILPTFDMMSKFVSSKVNPIAQQNQVIANLMKDKDNISIKQIGSSFIHYLGSQTDLSAIMLSLDMLVFDEIDKSPQDVLEKYQSRLQHSEYGYKWLFSNPTIPDFGCDKYWSLSDQKKWHITHSCGKIYILDEDCIDYQREDFVCPSCQNIITDEERRQGEWIKTSQGEWSGYHIPLWLNPMIKAKTICDYKKNSSREYFYNFVAGLPYVNPNDALTEKNLRNCLSSEINEQNDRIIIGLDTGHNLHYVLMNKQGVFYHGYCQSPQEKNDPNYDPYDEIEKLLKQYERSILIADQGGDLIGIRKLQQKYKGRVILCWSNKESKTQNLIQWKDEAGDEKVFIDRNRFIQQCIDEINERRVVFNGAYEDWKPFFQHALNIYRVKEITGEANDPQYGWRWVWKRKGADHYWMAYIYARAGLDRYAQDLAQIIKPTMPISKMGSDFKGDYQGQRFIAGQPWNPKF